jgi:hypothetical protein
VRRFARGLRGGKGDGLWLMAARGRSCLLSSSSINYTHYFMYVTADWISERGERGEIAWMMSHEATGSIRLLCVCVCALHHELG